MSVEAGILSSSGRRQATVALMVATAMQAFDTTIANVALPQIEQSLGGGIEIGSWVMTSYLCASAITATLTGWLRRRHGARPLFIGSISLFVIASGLCATAPSAIALIQFRLVQGAAAGVIQPLAQAILLEQDALKTSERQKLPKYGIPLLSLTHEKLSLITLGTWLNAISRSEFDEGLTPAVTIVAYEIGRRCRT